MAHWRGGIPSHFFPPPMMAYSWHIQALLGEDDRIGASLLYPTSRFARSVGSVGGRVVLDGEPAPFVYVQSLRATTLSEAGPGAFTDENGEFLLEGLEAGPVLLWIHPMLVSVQNPPGNLRDLGTASEGRSAPRDQWRWVTVTAGQTRIIPDIVATAGRHAEPR